MNGLETIACRMVSFALRLQPHAGGARVDDGASGIQPPATKHTTSEQMVPYPARPTATGVPAGDHPEPTKTRTRPKAKPSAKDKQGSLF